MSQTCVVNQLKSAAAATPWLAVPTPKSAEQKVHAAPKSTPPPAPTEQQPTRTVAPCVKKRLAHPIRRSLVPSAPIRGVAQKAILAVLPSGSAASAENVATGQRIVQIFKEESVVAMPVVMEQFIKFKWVLTTLVGYVVNPEHMEFHLQTT